MARTTLSVRKPSEAKTGILPIAIRTVFAANRTGTSADTVPITGALASTAVDNASPRRASAAAAGQMHHRPVFRRDVERSLLQLLRNELDELGLQDDFGQSQVDPLNNYRTFSRTTCQVAGPDAKCKPSACCCPARRGGHRQPGRNCERSRAPAEAGPIGFSGSPCYPWDPLQ